MARRLRRQGWRCWRRRRRGGHDPIAADARSGSREHQLVDLRITVDDRSNSIIAAGSPNDLDVIRIVIAKLEDTTIPTRKTEIVHLSGAGA